jgi:hypothetical protein
MKSVTEFPAHKLNQGLKAKTELAAAGKTPEEIQTSIGETFKMEGDKLKHFLHACEVAGQNQERLARVLVVALNEGETAPAKAVQFEEHHYVPDFMIDARKPVLTKVAPQKGGGDRKGKKGPKESPWGLSPEQKAAKKGGGAPRA